MFDIFYQSYGPWYLKFLHILAGLFNSSYIYVHCCMDWNEIAQKCCTTSPHLHVGISFMFDKFCRSYGSWNLEFLHISDYSLSSQLLLYCYMDLNETLQECRTSNLLITGQACRAPDRPHSQCKIVSFFPNLDPKFSQFENFDSWKKNWKSGEKKINSRIKI